MWGHSLSVSVKANEVPGLQGKNTEWSFHPDPGYSAVQTKVPCIELAVTAFLKSSQQILVKEEKVNASYAKIFMSNVQITKWRKNATTDKLNVNSLLICEEISLISRWFKVVRSLTPLEDFEPSKNQTTKKLKWVFTPPPRETQAGEYEVIIPAFLSCPGWGGEGFQMTGALVWWLD